MGLQLLMEKLLDLSREEHGAMTVESPVMAIWEAPLVHLAAHNIHYLQPCLHSLP